MSNIQISGFYDEVSSDLNVQIALAKRLGESYICPRSVDGKNIAEYTLESFTNEVYPRLQASGVRFSSIGSPIGKIALEDEESYTKQLAQLAELVKICQLMQCKYIRIFSFYVKPNCNYDECLPLVVEKLKGFLKVVEGSGVMLMHENEKEIFGDVPQRVLQIKAAIDNPDLGYIYDASNYIQCGIKATEAFDMVKDFTTYYHIKDCKAESKIEVPVGTGDADYDYIMSQLAQRGYTGFMTLEPHTVKYALGKIPAYVCVLASVFKKGLLSTFRGIDKHYGIKAFQSVSREQVFLWQYEGLKAYLKKYFD